MEQLGNDEGKDFKAGENEYAQLGAEDLYAQHKQDVKVTREVEKVVKATSAELPRPESSDTRAVQEQVKQHLNASVESARGVQDQHIEEAKTVSGDFVDEARSDMKAEMAQRTERLKTDEEIEAAADERIGSSITDTGALGPAEVLIYEPEKVRKYYPGYGDQDLKLVGQAIVRKVETATGRTFKALHSDS